MSKCIVCGSSPVIILWDKERAYCKDCVKELPKAKGGSYVPTGEVVTVEGLDYAVVRREEDG